MAIDLQTQRINLGQEIQADPGIGDTLSVLISELQAANAQRVLDIGCGDGTIVAEMAAAGFQMTGLDPSDNSIARAQQKVPEAQFLCSTIEDLPDDLPLFDAAYFVNSLHHVELSQMPSAIRRAIRAVKPDGIVVVIEPMAQGSFFRAMRPVEDETQIRSNAINILQSLISDGHIALQGIRRWNRENRFADLEDFVDYLTRAAPERGEIARRNAAALARAWRDNIRSVDGMALLLQPLIGWIVTAPDAALRSPRP